MRELKCSAGASLPSCTAPGSAGGISPTVGCLSRTLTSIAPWSLGAPLHSKPLLQISTGSDGIHPMFGEIVHTCKPCFPGVSLKVCASLSSVDSDTPMGTTTTSLLGKEAATNQPAQGRLLVSWPPFLGLVSPQRAPSPWAAGEALVGHFHLGTTACCSSCSVQNTFNTFIVIEKGLMYNLYVMIAAQSPSCKLMRLDGA